MKNMKYERMKNINMKIWKYELMILILLTNFLAYVSKYINSKLTKMFNTNRLDYLSLLTFYTKFT